MAVIKLYNTLTRQKEVFTPPPGERAVSIYACGPTVYDYAHIGNLRTYIFNDILRRVLAFNNYEVQQVMNITDVDDKTIKASREQNIPLPEYTKKFEDLFWQDLAKLNILKPNITPHATEYINSMIALIEALLAKKAAYIAPDGLYFDIREAKNYGALSGRLGAQSASGDENFALWKFEKDEDAGVAWDAPFGRGRPGWHIECSAMISATLGQTVDIHTGGTDLIFPHHENELAQSEMAHDAPLARYWLHGGFMNVQDEKMSKSLNNFITLRSLEEKNISPLAYRYWLLQAKYRTTINFTWEAIQAAQTGYERLKKKIENLPEGEEVNQDLKRQFLEAINDDLNTAKALTILPDCKKTWREFEKVLGLGL